MDGHAGPYPGHASFNIPPILAVGEYVNASGKDVALATVLGYEVNIRLQLSAGDPDISRHGWSGSTNLGIASAVGMGKLLGLTVKQLTHAIAIAATHAPALDAPSRDQMPESKTVMDGMVAASSVMAVFMAQAGLTGPARVFEGVGGYQQAVSRRLDTDILLAPLDRFRIMDVYTKRYNAVKCAQTAVAAALKIAAQLPGGWRDIEQLRVGFPDRDFEQQNQDSEARRRPDGRDTANHSAVYCVAAGLVDGDLGPEQFEDGRLHDPDVLGLIDRIRLEKRSELNEFWPAANPAHLTATTRTGEIRSELVLYSPGHPKNPLSDEALAVKFRALTTASLSPDAAEAAIRDTSDLARLSSVRSLLEALQPH
jgi:2-methylcitrate dehydratase